MKKLTALVLAVLLIVSFGVTASAAGDETESGFYGIGTAQDLTVTPDGTKKDSTVGADFYAGSEKLTVNFTAAQSGSEYLVLLVSGSGLPTEASQIRYIDQKTAEGSAVSFTVYPTMGASEDLTLLLTSNAQGFKTVSVPAKYYAAYKVGDVDGNNDINAQDASLILRYCVGTYDIGTLNAADVDGNKDVNAQDASLILRYCVGTYNIQ